MSVLVFVGLAMLLMLCDWKHRAIPRAVPIIGAVVAAWSLPGSPLALVGSIAVGIVVALLADLPAGDMATGGMIGAWLGIESTLIVWVLALAVGNVIWAAWEDRLINWPGEWPFTPLLLVPACVIVLAKGGW